MVTNEEFSAWLQQEIAKRGWDQAELARRSKITPGQVSHILSGDRKPGSTACRGIARALQLPPEEVFRHAGLLPMAHKTPEGIEELQFYYREMNAEDRKRLLMIARTLYKGSAEG